MANVRKLMKGLYDPDAAARWGAVRDIGAHAERGSVGSARELMRRLAWSLNDESGATGWGAPEAMGEIMGRIPDLVGEFAHRLPSYLHNEDVYLGNEVLDAGTIWAIGRLGPDSPAAIPGLADALAPFLAKGGPLVRAACAYTVGRLALETLRSQVEALSEDEARTALLIDGEVVEGPVADFAADALTRM